MPIQIATGQAAAANVGQQPANLILYGPPGTEKTTDVARAFTSADGSRSNVFFIPCEDGALKPILRRGLPVPDHVQTPVKSWGEMQEVMNWLAHHRNNYAAVCIDTLSTFTMYLYKELEERFKGNKNKFLIPVELRNCLFVIREWLRWLNLHTILICHSMEPEAKEGVFYRGGPLLAPKTMIGQYYGLIDTVLRVDTLVIPGRAPSRVYWTGGETWPQELGAMTQPMDWRAWRTKNREGCGAAVVPADLGAFLRSVNPPYARL